MQLTYRSAQYEVNVPVITTNGEINSSQVMGIYRGTAVRIHFPPVQQKNQSAIQLKYRGISYCGLHPAN
jgi:Domain of unknown function (DUF4278)